MKIGMRALISNKQYPLATIIMHAFWEEMRQRHEHQTTTVYHRRLTVSDLVISPDDQDEVCLGIRASFPCSSASLPTPNGTPVYSLANICRSGFIHVAAVPTATAAPSDLLTLTKTRPTCCDYTSEKMEGSAHDHARHSHDLRGKGRETSRRCRDFGTFKTKKTR